MYVFETRESRRLAPLELQVFFAELFRVNVALDV